jgi:antitoxin (DNA-binding transcriptional repressor) of toxin-antitoxin stability system
MSEVTVREFSRNPSAFFALAERGESMTITKRGMPIAIVAPASGDMGKYAPLVADGRLKLKAFTTSDIRTIERHKTERDGSPIQTILDMREDDDTRRQTIIELLKEDDQA